MLKTQCEKPLEVYFRASRRASFSYFPKVPLDYGRGGDKK